MGFAVEEKEISKAVIKRLPRYYRYLGDLMDEGCERVSSKELSERMHVTASQIRQDLNNFGGFGQQGYGYNVKYLYNEIGKILGMEKNYDVIIIGAGNLGSALSGYSDFARRGFKVTAIFDTDSAKIGRLIHGIKILSDRELEDYIKTNKPDIAALTLPRDAAADVAAHLVKWGIGAIWNFAPVDLRLPESVVVENIHLSDSLMRISYALKEKREKEMS